MLVEPVPYGYGANKEGVSVAVDSRLDLLVTEGVVIFPNTKCWNDSSWEWNIDEAVMHFIEHGTLVV